MAEHNQTSPTSRPESARSSWILLGILALLLTVLFHKSFESGQVVFANDGPLGALKAQSPYAWSNFTGYWRDLNWLGDHGAGSWNSLGYILFAALGAVPFAKFIVPLSLLFLGFAGWFFFRQLRFHPVVCVLGGLAAALNMNAFSVTCWGLSGWSLSRAWCLIALGFVMSVWRGQVVLRILAAGLALGMALNDGLDVGAIYSLYLAAFVMVLGWIGRGAAAARLGQGALRVSMVALLAALISAQALTTLVGTQVKGVAGMQQDAATKEKRWTEATRASLAPVETLRLVIPGLFGYRMADLYYVPPESLGGANYWGTMGAAEGYPQTRHSGNGEFAGVLVCLIAVWAVAQSFRRKNGPFGEDERRLIWFWAAAAAISLLLAWGKYTPFYKLVYAIPYFSALRNPFKFLHPLHLILVILFGYGLQGLWRAYLKQAVDTPAGWLDQVKAWWKLAAKWDRRWTLAVGVTVAVSLLAWLAYAGSSPQLMRHLMAAGFPDDRLARDVASFSIRQVGWFFVFLGMSCTAVLLLMSGAFNGGRARWAGAAFGLLLVIDLVRADLPWIVHYDYTKKYASNPVIDFLRENTTDYRSAAELSPLTRAYLINEQAQFFTPYYFEWLQHHFQFYRVRSLDIIQMPRIPEFDLAYMSALRPASNTDFARTGRLWELTSSRYIIGMRGFLDILNERVDPIGKRFRVHTSFNVVPKAGLTGAQGLEELTAAVDPNGAFALFEYAGALPRARLYSNWQTTTNDAAALALLARPDFNPATNLLVAADSPVPPPAVGPTNNTATPDAVEILQSDPKRVRLAATATAPSVLLLNDRHDPDWHVYVDGQRQPLLRCNYIMRGVYLTPGQHSIEFRFEPGQRSVWVSTGFLILFLLLITWLSLGSRKPAARPAP